MSRQIPEIRLIKFEGPIAFTQCQLLQNNKKHPNFDGSIPSTFIPIESETPYHLEFQTPTQGYYFSFSSKTFSEEGMTWHTLTQLPNKLNLTENKDQVSKILVLCKNNIIENTQQTEPAEFMPQLSLFGGTVDMSVYSEKIPETENLELNAAVYLQSDMDLENCRNLQVIEVLNSKSLELNKALTEINSLKSRIYKLEAENLNLKTAALFYHPSQNLLNEINTQKEVLKEGLENNKQAKTRMLNSKALQLALTKECLKLGVSVPLQDDEMVFTVNKVKLNLFLESNQLFYRTGNTVKPFKSFKNSNQSSNFNLKTEIDTASTKTSKKTLHSNNKCSK